MIVCRRPTPIQAEAMPLILGGGDVMAAAETGSGKTGAFALPVLQIVYEARIHEMTTSGQRERARGGGGEGDDEGEGGGSVQVPVRLDPDDRTDGMAITPDGRACQSRSEHRWEGCRATGGAAAGCVYYEATVKDEGLCRIGWATSSASLDIGTDKFSFGYGGTGKKSHGKQFETYGEPFGKGDVIGCWLDCESGTLGYTKNGQQLGAAYTVPRPLGRSGNNGRPLFPAFSLKNAELTVNFGGTPFKHPLPPPFTPLQSTQKIAKSNMNSDSNSNSSHPLALVLEPSRDLAEQTFENICMFSKYLLKPSISAVLLIGGSPPAPQIKALAAGVDIVVGTPGRVVDLVEKGSLVLDTIKFFVLDEADRLLDTGNKDAILNLFRRFPKAGTGIARLQVLLFSATLHSPEVRMLGSKICDAPILVDLKGKETIPETVDHLVVMVDPAEDKTWLQSTPTVWTDAVHALDPPPSPTSSTPEAWSQAVKTLKPRLLRRLVDSLQIDQALIFCRTNFDCDNLEKFLNTVWKTGSDDEASRDAVKRQRRNLTAESTSTPHSPYSCLVLAGARSVEERKAALRAFKSGEVRFLIATDVAARGIDIQGLPCIINMTLPDKSEDYIHRVGRVGRAEARGLAISFVSTVPEKVWYCTVKGLKPWLKPDRKNTKTTAEKGGHTVWQEEWKMLQDVEARLNLEVPKLSPGDFSLPYEIAARMHSQSGSLGGEAKYGQNRSGIEAEFARDVAKRAQALQPALRKLSELEHQAQASFFALQHRWAGKLIKQ